MSKFFLFKELILQLMPFIISRLHCAHQILTKLTQFSKLFGIKAGNFYRYFSKNFDQFFFDDKSKKFDIHLRNF